MGMNNTLAEPCRPYIRMSQQGGSPAIFPSKNTFILHGPQGLLCRNCKCLYNPAANGNIPTLSIRERFATPRTLFGINSSLLIPGLEKMTMLRKMLVMLVCSVLLFSSGCSVFMAAKQPDKKNVELYRIGTPRSMLLGEFGPPAHSEVRNGKKYEVFKFVQGYSTGAKAGRALFHGAADVMTLGLWEVVGTTREASFSGDEMAYEVSYDQDDRVDQVTVLKK